MTVVYVDSVFGLNALMDYLLFLATARLAGIVLRRKRYVLASLLGGLYAVCCFLPGGAFLSHTVVKGAVGVLLALVAFGGEERFLRLTVLLFALSCGLAGCVLALGLLSGGAVPAVNGVFYTDINIRVLLIAATAAYFVLTVVFRSAAAHGVRGELLAVRVCIGGRTGELTALHDTGNSLCDPVSGQAVLVISRGVLDALWPEEVLSLLTAENLRAPAELLAPLRRAAPYLSPRLLPYNAVGAGEGMLLALRTDWAEIGGRRYSGMTIALSPTRMETGALWGGSVRKGGADGHFSDFAKDTHPTGTSDAPGRPLHRRKRYTSTAPFPGTGDGAFDPSGGGKRTEGAH